MDWFEFKYPGGGELIKTLLKLNKDLANGSQTKSEVLNELQGLAETTAPSRDSEWYAFSLFRRGHLFELCERTDIALEWYMHALGEYARLRFQRQGGGEHSGMFAAYIRALELQESVPVDLDHEARLLSHVGDLLRDAGRYVEAEVSYTNAASQFGLLGFVVEEARVTIKGGFLCQLMGRWENAEKFFRVALKHGESWNLPEIRGESLNRLASLYKEQQRWDDAQATFIEAMTIFDEMGERKGQAVIQMNLGGMFIDSGAWAQAEACYARSLDLSSEGSPDHANVLNSLGVLHTISRQWRKATDEFERALHGFRSLSDIGNEALVLTNFGALCKETGRWGQAEQSLAKALVLYEGLGRLAEQAWVHNQIGLLLRAAGRSGAAPAFDRALNLYSGLGNPAAEAMALSNLGLEHQRAGRLDKAGQSFARLIDIYGSRGLRADLARTHLDMGCVHKESGRPTEAQASYELSLRLYRELGLVAGQADCFDALGMMAISSGNIAESETLLERAFALYESQGLLQYAASTDTRRAMALLKSGCSATDCLTLVIPAALFLESVRFQFRGALERVAWVEKAVPAYFLALKLAVESKDPSLIADLVETSINSVIHRPGALFEPLVAGAEHAKPRRQITTVEPIEAPVKWVAPGGHGRLVAAGTVTLLAASSLPGQQPPHLVIPSAAGGRIALRSWYASSRYASTFRRSAPVRTW